MAIRFFSVQKNKDLAQRICSRSRFLACALHLRLSGALALAPPLALALTLTLALGLGIAGFNSTAHASVPTEDRPVAVLRALDKITARVEELSIQVERPLKFGAIIITVRSCRVTPPEETPEAAAFVEVQEFKPDPQQNRPKERNVFQGWMFASSPALSAMEHPVYDLWVTGCKTASTN